MVKYESITFEVVAVFYSIVIQGRKGVLAVIFYKLISDGSLNVYSRAVFAIVEALLYVCS